MDDVIGMACVALGALIALILATCTVADIVTRVQDWMERRRGRG